MPGNRTLMRLHIPYDVSILASDLSDQIPALAVWRQDDIANLDALTDGVQVTAGKTR